MATQPEQLPVQFNLRVPWDFKQFMDRKSRATNKSRNQLAMDALMECYGAEFAREQAPASR